MTAWKQAALCIGLIPLLVGCQTSPRIPEPKLTNQTWRLKQVDDYAFIYDRYNLLPQLWLVADDNVFSGRDACTPMGGEYHQKRFHRLEFRLNTDSRHCKNNYTQRFIQRLNESRHYFIKDQQLFIIGRDRKVHIVFEAREGMPEAPIYRHTSTAAPTAEAVSQVQSPMP